nr:MAG TPA: hypothetical protein [Caudoviricetes sp.]
MRRVGTTKPRRTFYRRGSLCPAYGLYSFYNHYPP